MNSIDRERAFASPPEAVPASAASIWGIGFVAGPSALAAAILVWIETARFGVGATPDSVAYLSTAESLLAGRGLRLFDGSPYADWPPLYPWLLATLARLGPGVLGAARLLHVGLAAAIVLAVAHLAVRTGASRSGAALAAVAAVVVPPFLEIAPMAWSEPLFVAILLAFFLALLREREQPSPATWAALTTLAAAAILTRYLGVVLLPIGVLALARRGILRALAFAAVAAAPLAVWAARNVVTLGAPFGRRRPGGLPILESIARLDAVVADWILPVAGSGLAVGLGIATLIGLASVAARRTPRAAPLAAFALLYPTALVVVASRAPVDPLDARLLFPLALPLVVLASVAGSALVRPVGVAIAAIAAFAWIVPSASAAAATVGARVAHGAGGYATASWKDAAVSERLAAIERGEPLPVYTNAPDALWAISGRQASFTPWRAPKRSGGKPVPGRHWPTGRFRVVWFDRVERSYLRPFDELGAIFAWKIEASFDGGRIARADGRTNDAHAEHDRRRSGFEWPRDGALRPEEDAARERGAVDRDARVGGGVPGRG